MWKGRNRSRVWLSPEAYDALSPSEKRALWIQQKQHRSRGRPERGGRPRSTGSTPWLGFGAVLAVTVAVGLTEFLPAGWFSDPVRTATGQMEVRASFGLCHTGGGTNCVVDGDTIWLQGENIRIADIDAPETHDYGCPAELALGNRATQRLHTLVNSGVVTLGSTDRDQDGYGRKLRLVYVDGESVGDTLVDEGLARYYRGGKRPWC